MLKKFNLPLKLVMNFKLAGHIGSIKSSMTSQLLLVYRLRESMKMMVLFSNLKLKLLRGHMLKQFRELPQ